nr:UDP-4-amino-4,6-dideoxy-N-acetyl-beta-L-altrosamine N-acetyltransferase [uncultured Catonella sp.]
MEFKLRKIIEDDLELIMKWRMSPDITKYMRTNPKLTLEGQKKWLEKINISKEVEYWMILVDDMPAGIINLADIDWKNKRATWGWYVGEKHLRSFQLAISLEMSLQEYVFEKLKFNELYSDVLSENKGVIRINELCGSRVIKEEIDEVEKEGKKYSVTYLSITCDIWNEIKKLLNYTRINFDI